MSSNDKYSKSLESMSYKLERLEKKVNDFEPSKDLLKNKEEIDDFDAMFELYEEELKNFLEENEIEELSEQSIKEKIDEFKNKIEIIKNKYNTKKNIAKDIEQKIKNEELDYYKINKMKLNNTKKKIIILEKKEKMIKLMFKILIITDVLVVIYSNQKIMFK